MTPLLLLLAAAIPAANAAVPELYGMGPENIGMAGAATALADDPFAAYYNPAGLAQLNHVTLSLAPVFGQANLWGFPGIVYDTNADGETTDAQGYPDYGFVGADYRHEGEAGKDPLYTNGLMLGVAFPFRRWGALGLAAYVPSASLLGVETADPYIPYYLRYKSMNNRFTLTPALAIEPLRGVHLGVGAQAMANIAATGTMSAYAEVETFPTDTGEDDQEGDEVETEEVSGVVKAQVQDLKIDIMPSLDVNFGVLIDFSAFSKSHDPEVLRKLRRHAVGFNYRAPWKTRTSADITAGAYGNIQFGDETILLSELAADPVEIKLSNLVAFYTPASASVGFRTGLGDAHGGENWTGSELARLTITGDAVWTQWSKFVEMTSPYQEMTVESLAGTGLTIQVGDDYGKPAFSDTISYRGGARYTFGPIHTHPALGGMKIHLRAGGAFEPTPVPAQKGLTNYMDNDRYVAAAGLGVEIGHLSPFARWEPIAKGPVRFDVGGQYHYLTPRTALKDDDLLSDMDGDGMIEYPRGYPLGGKITSGGNTWVVSAGLQFQFSDAPKAPPGARNLLKKNRLPPLPLGGVPLDTLIPALLPSEDAGPDGLIGAPVEATGAPGTRPEGTAPLNGALTPEGTATEGSVSPTGDGPAPTGEPGTSAPETTEPEATSTPTGTTPPDLLELETPPDELSPKDAKKAAKAAKAAAKKRAQEEKKAADALKKAEKKKKGKDADAPPEIPDDPVEDLEDEPEDADPEPPRAPTPDLPEPPNEAPREENP